MDKWTNGPMDQWSKWLMDQWANGLMDRYTNGHLTFSCDPCNPWKSWHCPDWLDHPETGYYKSRWVSRVSKKRAMRLAILWCSYLHRSDSDKGKCRTIRVSEGQEHRSNLMTIYWNFCVYCQGGFPVQRKNNEMCRVGDESWFSGYDATWK